MSTTATATATSNLTQEEAAAAVAVTLVVGCDKVKREIEDAVLDQLMQLQYGDNVVLDHCELHEDWEDGCARMHAYVFDQYPASISSPSGSWTAPNKVPCLSSSDHFDSKDLCLDIFNNRPEDTGALRLEFFRFCPGYDYEWDEECKNLKRTRDTDVFKGTLNFYTTPVNCKNKCDGPSLTNQRLVLSFRTRGRKLIPYAPNRICKMQFSICSTETFESIKARGGMMPFQANAARPFHLIL